jgi:competence protein ComGC|tara:strand:+ start:76 stop:234 length:159 start_codon:yes stop_codon:yes gene_type:complete
MLMNIFILLLIIIALSCVFVPFFMNENKRINDKFAEEDAFKERLVPRRNNDN